MVAVVWRIASEVEVDQLRLRIPSVGVVDPATPHMSWRLHELMEAKIVEHCGEEVPGLLVEAHIEIASDDGRSVHADHLLKVVNDVLKAGSFRPKKRYLMMN